MAHRLLFALLALAAVGLGANVQMLEAEGTPAPAPAAAGTPVSAPGQVTLPALDEEIKRAKASEKEIGGKVETEATARSGEDQALTKAIEDTKKMLANEVTARDKLANDTSQQSKSLLESMQKSATDSENADTAMKAKLEDMKKQIAAEATAREDADAKLKQGVKGDVAKSTVSLQNLETQINEHRTGETKKLEKRDQGMVASVTAIKDGLQREQNDRVAVFKEQAEMITALKTKVQDLAGKLNRMAVASNAGSPKP